MPLLSAYAAASISASTSVRRVTILALGRGVEPDGSLSSNSKLRVNMTLTVARDLQKRGFKVQIIWTGGRSLKQVKEGVVIGGAGSEGAAMLAFALSKTALILVMTDALHFKYGRVRFAARLAFPGRDIELIEMPFPFGRKQHLAQAVSAFVTAIGMIGVKRGNKKKILDRQTLLEALTRRG